MLERAKSRPLNHEIYRLSTDRPSFQCGVETLDKYLKKRARQDMKRGISRVFVATQPGTPKKKVVGFYTLSSLSVTVEELPVVIAKKLPRHPIPAALLGRLANFVRRVFRRIPTACLVVSLSFSDKVSDFSKW